MVVKSELGRLYKSNVAGLQFKVDSEYESANEEALSRKSTLWIGSVEMSLPLSSINRQTMDAATKSKLKAFPWWNTPHRIPTKGNDNFIVAESDPVEEGDDEMPALEDITNSSKYGIS